VLKMTWMMTLLRDWGILELSPKDGRQ
jgi:hypothetical protein